MWNIKINILKSSKKNMKADLMIIEMKILKKKRNTSMRN